MIYFLRATPSDYVKIGYTRDETTLQTRIATLQTGLPWRLELLRIIDPAEQWVESMLHEVFAPQRHNGEWFTYTPVMMDITSDGWWQTRRIGTRKGRAAVEGLIERLVNLLDDWTIFPDDEPEVDDEPTADDEHEGDYEPDTDEYVPIKFHEATRAEHAQFAHEDSEETLQPVEMREALDV